MGGSALAVVRAGHYMTGLPNQVGGGGGAHSAHSAGVLRGGGAGTTHPARVYLLANWRNIFASY